MSSCTRVRVSFLAVNITDTPLMLEFLVHRRHCNGRKYFNTTKYTSIHQLSIYYYVICLRNVHRRSRLIFFHPHLKINIHPLWSAWGSSVWFVCIQEISRTQIIWIQKWPDISKYIIWYIFNMLYMPFTYFVKSIHKTHKKTSYINAGI